MKRSHGVLAMASVAYAVLGLQGCSRHTAYRAAVLQEAASTVCQERYCAGYGGEGQPLLVECEHHADLVPLCQEEEVRRLEAAAAAKDGTAKGTLGWLLETAIGALF